MRYGFALRYMLSSADIDKIVFCIHFRVIDEVSARGAAGIIPALFLLRRCVFSHC